MSFDIRTPWTATVGSIRVVFGNGSLRELSSLVDWLGCRRILLVTDPGIRSSGHVDAALEHLGEERVAVAVFDDVDENPTTEHVEAGLLVARDHGPDLIVGLGGGSAMDCAKGINFLLTNGGKMADYWGEGKAQHPMLPTIGIPTTAGTGSEAQAFALIANAQTHEKMACGSEGARFRGVILDPELTRTVPRVVAIAAGIDAISHAVESYVTTDSNLISRIYARQAWRLLTRHFPGSIEEPDEYTLAAMLLGAYLAGAAIDCSMLGAAHACANPLTANYGVTHGVAVGLMLPHVVRFNELVASSLYVELDSAAPGPSNGVAGRFADLWSCTGLASRLRDHGVEEGALKQLAREASRQWTASFNPRPVDKAELLELYRAAF